MNFAPGDAVAHELHLTYLGLNYICGIVWHLFVSHFTVSETQLRGFVGLKPFLNGFFRLAELLLLLAE